MASEIFRFAVVHPPQTTSLEKVTENSFFLSASDEGLVGNLRKAKKENDKPKMIKLAQGYTKSSKFIDSAKKVDTKLIKFIDVVNSKSKSYNTFLRENFQRIFSLTPSKFIDSPVYKQTYKAVSESLVAAAIDETVSPKSKSLIVNLVKALQIINLIVKDKPVTREQVSQIKIILPYDVFPLPMLNTNLKEHRKKQAETQKKAIEERRKKNLALSQELKSYTAAIDEILKVFDNSNLDDDDDDLPADAAKRKGGFYMPKKAVERISADTKNVIKKIGLSAEEIDIVKTVNALEKYAGETAQKIYAGAGRSGRMARIGSNDVVILDEDFGTMLDPFAGSSRTPGVCPPTSITVDDSPTPITTNGNHDVRILGTVYLHIVEQELARYELGEISHIENVLKSELRDRKHRINNLTEESVTTETEETDFKENDLSSTERFELQTESQKVINESTSMEAGATVSASYGYVDTTANFNYSTSDSSSETQRSASNFARETTSKAVNKLEKRNLERRFRRTVRETEEINQHTFDNKAGTDNISGVYRFVDKIYNAQIVNYGKRLMLEFIVPEPAAFLRHAMTSQPVETTAVKPDEPGFCSDNGRRFTPLQVQDIDRNNYLIWASKYGVEGIKAPPPRVKIFSKAKTADGETFKEYTGTTPATTHKTGVDSFDIDIDSGYIPQEANIISNGITFIVSSGNPFTIQIQDKIIKKNITDLMSIHDGHHLNTVKLNKDFTKSIPVTIGTHDVISYQVIVNIICTLSTEKLDTWKMETYNAIMNAYKDQLTRYNNAIESARIRAGFTEIRGTNPFINRETEKTELKRGCITLLTGQQFESFDAMNHNFGVNGYPEIDFKEAAYEGKLISFYEQAFEWNNMTYVFYPYFWANKKQWLQLSQLKDTDPIFTKFLQAGSCRVNVPVRPDFDIAMLNYVFSNIIWNSEGILVNAEDEQDPYPIPHLSLLEELKSQMNNMNTDGIGKLNVTKDSNLVTGIETIFTIDDENKRIIVGGKTYIIKAVDSENSIQLKTAYTGETQTGLTYSFGAKLVGESWEVKLPTDLVKIDRFEI